MKIIKDFIEESDKAVALQVNNRLKTGKRVFGNPAEGLKKTLKTLEERQSQAEKSRGVLDYLDGDKELKADIAKLNAGIRGEEKLAEYLERVVKYDELLQDIIFFASLSDPEQSVSEDYISDSDFVAVYGEHILILDAKNIPTNPELPLYLDGNALVAAGGKEILVLHSSVQIWRNIFNKNGNTYLSIHGCTVIINDYGACIWKNKDWQLSETKPMHVSDLVEFLHNWIKEKEPVTNLSLLTTLAKMQVKKEDCGLNIRNNMKRFGV